MTSIEEADSWIGRTALDSTGEQIGIITQIWVDDASGKPEWASVKGSAIRRREALVPLGGNGPYGSGRQFAYTKDEIIDSPQGAEDGRLEVGDKERLSSYYGPSVTDPDSGPETWIDRMENAADGATVREITALLGGGAPGPAPQAPVKLSRRLRRKPASSEPKAKGQFRRGASASSEPKAKRQFRRNASPSDQQPAELSPQPDEVGFRH